MAMPKCTNGWIHEPNRRSRKIPISPAFRPRLVRTIRTCSGSSNEPQRTNNLNAGKLMPTSAAQTTTLELAEKPRDFAEMLFNRLAKAAPILIATPMAIFGVQHFIYLDFVANFMPPWIPWRVFWACFTGVALIAAAVG